MNAEDLLEATAKAYANNNPFMLAVDHKAALRAALTVALEEAAKVAEDAYKRGHLKQDIDSEIEPDAIAAAIRALKPKD